jgi:hypothetical protein
MELVIVAIIHQRVPKNEIAWYLRLPLCHAPYIQQQYNPTHNSHFLRLPRHSRNIGKPRKMKEKRGSIYKGNGGGERVMEEFKSFPIFLLTSFKKFK